MLLPFDRNGFFYYHLLCQKISRNHAFSPQMPKVPEIRRRHFVVAIGIGPCLLPLHPASSLRKTGGELFQGIYYTSFTVNKKAVQWTLMLIGWTIRNIG
jgi:hypothetical protein